MYSDCQVLWVLYTFHIFLIGNGSISEILLKLQGSLLSVKHNYESSEIREDSQMTFQSVIDRNVNETYFVAWASRTAKREAVMRTERLLQDKFRDTRSRCH